jgi:ribonuclease HII
MQRALDDVHARFPDFAPDCLFLDALIWPEMANAYPQITIVDGDARSVSIAAASIIAKTSRDALMRDLDSELPQYTFGKHKGYGTGAHRAVLTTLGPSSLHRLSFKPVQKALQERQR